MSDMTMADIAAPVLLEANDPNELPFATKAMHIKAIRPEMREADFVASTDTVDSYGDSVSQNWDLSRYQRNPVILYAHNSRELPIGRATMYAVQNGQLECTIRFAREEANPKAEQVWKLVQDKMLNAVSVGFYPHTIRYEMRNDVEVCVLDDNELFEISVVPVPANPDALGKMKLRAKGAMENHMKTFEEVKAALESTEKRAEAAEKRAEAAEITQRAVESENTTLKYELSKTREKLLAVEKAEKDAKDALIERDVDALVGVKITPAEREPMLELARANRELFDKMIEKRPELKLLGASPITAEPSQENSAATEPTGDDLALAAAEVAAKTDDDD